MADIMIDIETLSTESNAAVIAIGMCKFDAENIYAKHSILIDPQLTPGHRCPDTLEFWAQQDPVVFAAMMAGTTTPWNAMIEFQETIADWRDPDTLFWANSPSFDFTILRTLNKALFSKREFAFMFWKEMDFRTLKHLADFKDIGFMEAYEGHEPHDCVSDAVCQAKAVQIIISRL